MTSILNTIQAIVRQELRGLRLPELGLVEAVYPHHRADDDDNYGCDVRLKNNAVLLQRVPIATGHIGTVAIPNIGDLVLVAFDGGNLNGPIIVGRLYNDTDRPPLNDPNELIFRLPLASPDEKTVLASIKNIAANTPPREIVVAMPPKITLQINDGTIKATAGKTQLTLDQTSESGGTVTVLAGATKMVLNQDGDVTIEAAGAMSLSANGDVSITGQNVKISALMAVDIEAQTQFSVTAAAGAMLDGGLSVGMQGATVQISGITSFGP